MSAEADNDPLGLASFAAEVKALDLRAPTVQHSIDGLVYTSTKLPAGPAGGLLPVVLRMMLPMLQAGSGIDAITTLASAMVNDDWIAVCRRLFARTDCGRLCEREKAGPVCSEFDEHFAGEFPHLARVFLFVALHNFAGFSRGAR